MGKRLKPTEWKTYSIQIDFSNLAAQPLGWSLQTIIDYKAEAIPLDANSEIDSQISSVEPILCGSKGEPVELNDAINIILDSVQAEWNTLVLWVAKDKWMLFNIYDGPLPEIVMWAYKPRAQFMIAELKLWNAIFDISKNMKTALPYNNCIEGWTLTQIESKREDIANICKGTGQHTLANRLSKEERILKDYNNPFLPNDLHKTHHHNMIEAALSIARNSKRREQEAVESNRKKFRVEAWNPYLNALAERVKALRLGVILPDGSKVKIKTLFVKGGCLMLQDGNQARQIYPPPQKKSLTQRGKYKRNA